MIDYLLSLEKRKLVKKISSIYDRSCNDMIFFEDANKNADVLLVFIHDLPDHMFLTDRKLRSLEIADVIDDVSGQLSEEIIFNMDIFDKCK